MRVTIVCLLLLNVLFVFSEPQYNYGNYYPLHFPGSHSYFRSQPIHDGEAIATMPEGRLFLSPVTLTLSTTTVTKTVTSSTVCTTTTAALVACVAAGGRKRRQPLFYTDDPLMDDETSVFLPLSEKELEKLTPSTEKENDRLGKDLPHYPISLQSGFNPLSRSSIPRFLLAVDTSTIFTTTTSLVTVSLTAICSSTTTFSACVLSG